MNMNKKKRSDWRRMKSRVTRKLKRKFLREHRESRSVFDQRLVEKSNNNKECLEKEIKCLRLKLKLLKDAYEKEKKIYENCIVFKEQCLKVEFPKIKKESKETLSSENSFLRRENDEIELQSPRVVKKEYVEYETYVENETVKSEPIDQFKFKKEPLVAFKKSK